MIFAPTAIQPAHRGDRQPFTPSRSVAARPAHGGRPDDRLSLRFAGHLPLTTPAELAMLPPGPDFSNRQFDRNNFAQVLRARTLKKTNFSNSNLQRQHLEGKELQGSRFDGADLRHAHFNLAILEDVQFRPTAQSGPTRLDHCFMDGARISRANFEHASLRNSILTGVHGVAPRFVHAQMQHGNLTHSQLLAADFEYADLSMADLRGIRWTMPDYELGRAPKPSQFLPAAARLANATLLSTDLTGAILLGADFSRATLSTSTPAKIPTRLLNTDLRYAQFNQAKLPGLHIVKSQLQHASFRQANLQDTHFIHTHLDHADFSQADASRANFSRIGLPAPLRGAQFRHSTLTQADFSGLKLHHVNWQHAHMHQVNLSRTTLRDCNLGDTQLIGADLSDSKLKGVSLRRAKLQGANLSQAQLQGADLRDIQVDDQTRWHGAIYDRHTQLPTHIRLPLAHMIYEPSLFERLKNRIPKR